MPRTLGRLLAPILAIVALLTTVGSVTAADPNLSVITYAALTGGPVAGAGVVLSTGPAATSDVNGIARFTVPAGNYSLTASLPGANSGTVITEVRQGLSTIVYVALTPLGNPTSPYPAVRSTVWTTLFANSAGSQLALPNAETRVVLTNAAAASVSAVTLAIAADPRFPIIDCWAGVPGQNPCNRPGNNDAQWLVGTIGAGSGTGPFVTTYAVSQLPSATTAGRVEVVETSWSQAGVPAKFSVALGESVPQLTSWLDAPRPASWNTAGGAIPRPISPNVESRCASVTRAPSNPNDTQLTALGWTLFNQPIASQATMIVWAMASNDGMCRPNGFNAFVFMNGVFAGTLSPAAMDSRTDGQLSQATLGSASTITGSYVRYTSDDALCCPSSTTTVQFSAAPTTQGPLVTPLTASTRPNSN